VVGLSNKSGEAIFLILSSMEAKDLKSSRCNSAAEALAVPGRWEGVTSEELPALM